MPDAEKSRHVCKESLSSANVACSLVSSDVLLSRLHGHTVGNVVVSVLGDTDDSTRHLPFEIIFAGKVSWVRTTEAHGDTESLHAAASDVGAHFTCGLANGKRQNVLDDNRAHLVLSESREELTVVLHVADVVRSLDDCPKILVGLVPGELLDCSKHKLDSERASPRLDHINGLRED